MSALLPLLLLVPGARAAEPPAELETVAQLRHDLWGDSYVPLWSYLRVRKEVHGQVAYGYGIDGYVGLLWGDGLGRPANLDVYSLNVEREQSWGDWSVGRQRGFGSLRPQTFDGVRVAWKASDSLNLAGWAGWARHQDLDDLRDGVGMGRVDATVHQGAVVARLGAQVEAGPDTPFIARQDAEARASLFDLPLHPDALIRFVVAEPDPTVEWARVELGARPVSALRAAVHVQHRQAADPDALFGDAILESLAGDNGADEVGLSMRLSGDHFNVLSGSWSLVGYGVGTEQVWGNRVDASWMPGTTDRSWRLVPAYMFRSGPGGLFHAPSLTGRFDVTDAVELAARAAVVPYRQGHRDWDLVLAGSVDAAMAATDWLGISAQLDAARDPLYDLDLRGTAVVTLAVP